MTWTREPPTVALEGKELDAAVQLALGWKHIGSIGTTELTAGKPFCLSGQNDWWESPEGEKLCGPCYRYPKPFSTAWEKGGPIIELERITVGFDRAANEWSAEIMSPIALSPISIAYGPTPLVAAMRAFVASKALK